MSSIKIADFTEKHKVSYVSNGVEKYASAVKIGNTNEYGWYEPTTPTEVGKLHTYLDFNNFNPYVNQICKKSKRVWNQWMWSGKSRIEEGFDDQPINLFKDHPPLTNRVEKNCFGNKQNNNFNSTHYLWNRTGIRHCEIEKKNIPFVGKKYTVSFWIKVNSKNRDSFHYYQNNQLLPYNDYLWRFANNLASNRLVVDVNPGSGAYSKNYEDSAFILIYQNFLDYNSSKYEKYWFNGARAYIPLNKWVYVNVSIDDNKMFIALNKEISSTKQFKYKDVSYANVYVNKIRNILSNSSKDIGRNYNFNDIPNSYRVHGLGIKSNTIQIADFRVYSNIAVSSYKSKFLSHLQNHRDQIGDLPNSDKFYYESFDFDEDTAEYENAIKDYENENSNQTNLQNIELDEMNFDETNGFTEL